MKKMFIITMLSSSACCALIPVALEKAIQSSNVTVTTKLLKNAQLTQDEKAQLLDFAQSCIEKRKFDQFLQLVPEYLSGYLGLALSELALALRSNKDNIFPTKINLFGYRFISHDELRDSWLMRGASLVLVSFAMYLFINSKIQYSNAIKIKNLLCSVPVFE